VALVVEELDVSDEGVEEECLSLGDWNNDRVLYLQAGRFAGMQVPWLQY
jgi:hypothetical protein